MANRLLEIGVSNNPAIQNPGYLFERESITYFAMDAWAVSRVRKYHRDIFGKYKHELYDTACRAKMQQLPYRDEMFKRVIMKSVIGEFSLGRLKGDDPRDINSMSLLSFAETMGGYSDVLRVLEPGGQVVIAEEDTPADCLQLAAQLSDVGFTGIEITPYSESFEMGFGAYDADFGSAYTWADFRRSTHDWRMLRGAYWSLNKQPSVTQMDYVNGVAEAYYRQSYVMVATKPDA